jgi:hypothetical protein
MRLIQNAIGISKLILILLLLISAIVGAVLSYMWTEGYYQSIGLRLPETATVTITNVTFDPQDPTFFDLTLLNPSFSPLIASVAQIMASTENGVLQGITAVTPSLPVELSIGESKTLKCIWNWADYTGQDIIVHVFVADGAGSNLEKKVPLVKLTITNVVFNSTISDSHFNVTVQNSASSVIDVDVSRITVNVNETTQEINVTNPELPYMLNKNSTVTFMCSWNWTNYQGMTAEVTVHTQQQFKMSTSTKIPEG